MHQKVVTAFSTDMLTFVEAFLSRRPSPDPPPIIPTSLLEDATFTQNDVDRVHFADEGGYNEFPPLLSIERVEFEALVDKWRRRREFRGSSRKGLENRLKRLFVDCLNQPANTGANVAALIASLEIVPEADVLLPLVGIDLQVPVWTIAQGISLVKMTSERFEADVVAGYEQAASKAMPWYNNAREYALGMANAIRGAFVDTAVLVVRAEGDEFVAQERAERVARDIVDVLQFATGVFHPAHWRTFIQFNGDVPVTGWRMTTQIPVAGDVRPNNAGVVAGMLAAWKIDENQLEQIRTERIDAIFESVLAKHPLEHEDMIKRAVHAFADGERQWSTDGKKLSYTTVFDIFFGVRGSLTTREIREGVAFTLYPSHDRLDERFELAQFINAVYDSRSRTTHDFVTGAFGEDELARLRLVALNLIGVMSKRGPFTKRHLAHEREHERNRMGADYLRFNKLSRWKQPETIWGRMWRRLRGVRLIKQRRDMAPSEDRGQ